MKSLLLGFTFMILLSCGNRNDTNDQALNDLRTNANLLYKENKYSEAVEAYDKLIKIDSLNGQLYFRRAYSLCQINKHQNSVTDYQRSASLGYKKFDSYYSLGIIYMTILLDDSLSIMYFKKCLEIDPNSEKVKDILRQSTTNNKSVVPDENL